MIAYKLSTWYEPKNVETRWNAFWEEQNTFNVNPDASGEPYAIVIPPPNITGKLHMGHALNITLQDVLCRHHRQLGKKVLWIPGIDHAGIATQNVVERTLKNQCQSRHDLSRNDFIDYIWQWKEEYSSRILNQIRRLGASVDWKRQRFTLDAGLSKAVREVFVRLYEEGLIYKGNYIVNWCSRCYTALADDEVEYTSKHGILYYIKYPLVSPVSNLDSLIVATTRPETIFGDTAIAVHPDDERYSAIIDSYVILPLVGRHLPIIVDHYVEKKFGTGCLKVTPAHNMQDWNLSCTHGLEIIKVIDECGRMTAAAGERWQGMSKEVCRQAVIKTLKAENLLVKTEPYDHKIGECYRCKTTIEPRISLQWFVATKSLAEKARAAVPKATAIYPEIWIKIYYQWLDNVRDWCISRQIWWGHRIPAWTCQICGKLLVLRKDPIACSNCGGKLIQDDDVLDTWFSSALWPFSTLGWPDTTKELITFYPTTVLVTAFDILFFWVARMMMLGIHFMGQVPFRDVYIHALVCDAYGKKMSKSVGNVVDPMDMINRFGADALRFTITALSVMGRDIRFSEENIVGYRHFCNKLWNAARFALMRLPNEMPLSECNLLTYPVDKVSGIHHAWFFHQLEELKNTVRVSIAGYYFNNAAKSLYHFIWHEFCDWYLEMLKLDLANNDNKIKEMTQICLWNAFREVLVLLHPFMPFITQEIWSILPGISVENRNLATISYPMAHIERHNPKSVHDMTLIQDTIIAVRNIRNDLGISSSKKLDVLIRTIREEDRYLLETQALYIRLLARINHFTVGPKIINNLRVSATAMIQGNQIFILQTENVIDFNAELNRLNKEISKLDKILSGIELKLTNKNFIYKAPDEIVNKEYIRLTELKDTRNKLIYLYDELCKSN